MMLALRLIAVVAVGCGGVILVMTLRSSLAWRILRMGMLALVYLTVSVLVASRFVDVWGFRQDHAEYGLMRLIDGTAHRPYVYRRLSPDIVDAAARAVHRFILDGDPQQRQALRQFLLTDSPLTNKMATQEKWDVEKSLRIHVAYVYVVLSLLAVLILARALLTSCIRASQAFYDYAPVAAELLLPLTFWRGGYIYDFAELAFLLAALLALLHDKVWLYLVVFIIAITNKESNLLLLVYFIAVGWNRLTWRRFVLFAGAQVVVGVAIYAAIRHKYLLNPGGSNEFWLSDNLDFWSHLSAYTSFRNLFDAVIPFPTATNVLILFLAALAIFHGWGKRPAVLRRLFLLSAIVNVPLIVPFAYKDEVRNLSLTFPAVFLMGAWGIVEAYGALNESGSRVPNDQLAPP